MFSQKGQTKLALQNVSQIIGIQFSIMSPDEIRRSSVAHITDRNTYDNNKPVIGGPFDSRMGVLEPGLICPTDGLDYMQTPGYFGHIELARPVFYIQYLTTIRKILSCVCIKCSKLLISKETNSRFMEMKSDQRWNVVFQYCGKIKRCGEDTHDGCGCLQPKRIKKQDMATLVAEWESTEAEEEGAPKKNLTMTLTPEIVIKIFRRISDEDVSFMGFSPQFSRPDWMVCQVLAVPPPAVRPSIKMDGQQRSEDDISHILVNIIKMNKTLQEKINDKAPQKVIDGWHDVLQYYVATQINNNIPGVGQVAQRSGRPLKSIMDRLNGKGGRVRGNLMGKRVDFSARSVITPDPNLSIRELGIPLKIAKNITKPITVNNLNKNFLLKLVRNGPDEYPGAKILEKKNGENISLRYADRENIHIENGDIVHRHIMDGDGVLFNRQPTLHRMSMMCHIAKVMFQGDTFRMNVGDTKPYNADFDGDEMNLHMPQDEESEAELKNLAAVPFQIISPANNQSIIGIFQDSLLGSYQFTRVGVKFDSRAAMNLLMALQTIDESLFSNIDGNISNFQILSQIMPPITLKYKKKAFGEKEDYNTSNNVLEIRDGKYLRGQLDKAVLGSGTNGLIHRTCNDFNNMTSAKFIDDLQNIITEYMKVSSYSVGISDLIANAETNNKIADVIISKKTDVKSLIDQLHIGVFDNKTGKTNDIEFENQVSNILNKAINDAGKIGLESLSKDNRFVTMVTAGSKGTEINISQMTSCLGQQAIEGKRIPYGFESRTLPHFTKYDDSPDARGFVESSFISGLRPEELFFHAMAGRIGLIDTAVKSVTWDTPIVVVEDNIPKYVKIGEWIDTHMKNNGRIQYMEEKNMEYLELDNSVTISTMDYDGKVSWETISAVTRHDPGNVLYKITTHGGRSVIVTENKSLLIWKEKLNQFREEYTEKVKVGDYVPVTKKCGETGVTVNEINMEKYLPKNEYIYGCEIQKAVELMKNAMDNRHKIPSNWWNENNNNTFILPFDSKARLQRATMRSNIDNIDKHCIYPFRGTRQKSNVPDKFKLDYENGLFIGLFIAEGNIHRSKIYITNLDDKIIEFVKVWFNKLNIEYTESTKTNNIGGTTRTICGNSSIMSKFITKLVGHGSENKHIPDEAYISNIDFVKGILSGYISGDGYISKNSIESSSASKRLTEGIAFLCSRIGVYARIFKTQNKNNNIGTINIKPSYRLSIRSTNGKVFSDQINIFHNDKDTKMKNIVWCDKYNNIVQHNDVILDKIVSIEKVDPALYPKMYDLTIPKTLNFGLANGLQVRDTSQTGYIQRRLIKGLEDLKVGYDMTVRNNKERIVQFAYGDDGIDTVKVENQSIPLVSMTLDEIYAHYYVSTNDDKDSILMTVFTKTAVTRMKKRVKELEIKTKFYTDMMITKRDEIVKNVFKMRDNKNVHLPVCFTHIINNIQGMQHITKNSMVDITPLDVYDMIEDNYKILEGLYYAPPTELFKAMYYYYLSPKELLVIKRFNKKALTVLLETITLMYKRALVAPGEMVGMIAAQSIGEPTTQLTLNTFHSAGVASKSNVTRGVPRIEEILSLSENPKNPSLTIYMNPDEEIDKDFVRDKIPNIELTVLKEIVDSVEICFDPDDMNTLIEQDKDIMSQYFEFEKMVDECMSETKEQFAKSMAASASLQSIQGEGSEGTGVGGSGGAAAEASATGPAPNEKSKWIIRMTMDRESMLDRKISMDDIHFALKNIYTDEVTCMYSDYNSDKLVFRLRLNNIITNSKKKNTNSLSLDQSDQIYILKNFQDNMLNNIVLRGVKGLSKVLLRKITDSVIKIDSAYTKKETWVLDTTGTNLLTALSLDYIDVTRTISNDIQEIYNVLGIEAARVAIFTELSEVLEFDNTYINYHHLIMLADRMTASAKMVSIFRHGINNDDIGPIAKASFEETPEMFLKAARHAELDEMRGVSANVMCGQEGFFGTSCFQVLLDMNKMIKYGSEMKYNITNSNDEIDKAFEMENPEDVCSIGNLSMNVTVSNIKRENLGNVKMNYNIGF